MKTDAREIGKRIKKLRKDRNLTQTEFGEKIGVKGNTVTGYENGTRRPSDSVINYICLIFHVDQTWLRTGEGDDDVAYLPDLDQVDVLSKVRSEFNCNELEMKFLTAYLGLEEKERDAFCKLLEKMFPDAISVIAGENPLTRTWQEALPRTEILESAGTPTVSEEERKAMREKAADLYDEQDQAEEKPDTPASSANESAVG